SWRRQLEHITRIIAEAAGHDRNAARERHHLLHTELEVAADQRPRGKNKTLPRFGTGPRAQSQNRLFEGSDTHDAMGESLMPTLLLARQRWYGRICAHEPLSCKSDDWRVFCSIHRNAELAHHAPELVALALEESARVLVRSRLHALCAERGAHLRIGERKRGLFAQQLDAARRHPLGAEQH